MYYLTKEYTNFKIKSTKIVNWKRKEVTRAFTDMQKKINVLKNNIRFYSRVNLV